MTTETRVLGRACLIGLSVFTLVAAARPAAAGARRASNDARILSVRVADDAAGSQVAVKLPGGQRIRVLRTAEHLASVALADVDADGDLDILASSTRAGILLWRNAGRGRFVLARLPRARDALAESPRASADSVAQGDDEPGEGSGDPALPRTDLARDPIVVQSFFSSDSFSPLTHDHVAATGRAPPSTR